VGLELQPITLAEANQFVSEHHRHHGPTVGHKFSIAVNDGAKVVGVAIVGRPVSRHFDDGYTAEVNRCCTLGDKNAPSMLYAACWRACRAMGYKRLITYTLASESGGSLTASGWAVVGQTRGGSWNCKSRPRVDKGPTGPKTLWEVKQLS
jgi:hypothetical protein